jgi:ubiquinone/menaquinone biosynthesis C-methylase UbiE
MIPDSEIKNQVRQFYDQVGWQTESDGFYQNASYEDLRQVSQEYIHKCHLRVNRHLNPSGRYLLDAGSGPIQYPEYLEYSKGYKFRVCADISIVALQEARKRIVEHGLYVVCDVANLPFRAEAFDGLVSLHTLHHLPMEQHVHAYQELYRTLAPNRTGVVVNGWYKPPLTVFFNFWMDIYHWLYGVVRPRNKSAAYEAVLAASEQNNVRGTYVRKENAAWLQKEVGGLVPVSIWCWRSISVRFLRTFIHERLAGRAVLRLVYWLEERAPHFLGRIGQYPLVELSKPK